MIGKVEQYHGSALVRLVRALPVGVHIRLVSEKINCAYVLNKKAVLYVKHSSSRLTPWAFTITPDQSADILALQKKFSTFYLLLVCNSDGVAAISALELERLVGALPLGSDTGI